MDFDAEKDYYRVLHLDRTATAEEVKKAFFVLAKKYHPDTKKSLGDSTVDEVFTEKYREVNDAHRVLGDPGLRSAYDRARDRLEHGDWQRETPPPASEPQRPDPSAFGKKGDEQSILESELPPVIQSDRGMLFLRRRRAESYIGEDGARYSVSNDGRIRRLPGQGISGSINRFVVVGAPGEDIFTVMARSLLALLASLARGVGYALLTYPLVLSMLFLHANPLRRLRQERVFMGWPRYGILVFLSLLALVGHVPLFVQGHEIVGGVSFALHLLASGLLALEFRMPYLTLLAQAGQGTAVLRGGPLLVARRGFIACAYLLQVSLTLILFAPLLSGPVRIPIFPGG